jgi:ATP-dependent exoDNAse (exonuclease V) alpha subunit
MVPEKATARQTSFSDAVTVLAQDRPAIGIVSGQGGAAGQRERVTEMAMMAREQGRDVHIIAADNRSLEFLLKEENLQAKSSLVKALCRTVLPLFQEGR